MSGYVCGGARAQANGPGTGERHGDERHGTPAMWTGAIARDAGSTKASAGLKSRARTTTAAFCMDGVVGDALRARGE